MTQIVFSNTAADTVGCQWGDRGGTGRGEDEVLGIKDSKGSLAVCSKEVRKG